MVDDIEKLGSKFEGLGFCEPGLFQKRHVELLERRSVECIPRQVPERAGGWCGERARVEKLQARRSRRRRIFRTPSYAIRPLVREIAIPEGVSAIVDGIRHTSTED